MSIQELALLFVIGLLVLGPERLPRVARQVGRWVGMARRTANELRWQLEREIAEADVAKARAAPASEAVIDPVVGTATETARPTDPEPVASDR